MTGATRTGSAMENSVGSPGLRTGKDTSCLSVTASVARKAAQNPFAYLHGRGAAAVAAKYAMRRIKN